MDDGGDGVLPGGDGLQDVKDACAFGFLPHFGGQALDDGFQAGLVFVGQHFEDLAGFAREAVAQFLVLGHGVFLVVGGWKGFYGQCGLRATPTPGPSPTGRGEKVRFFVAG